MNFTQFHLAFLFYHISQRSLKNPQLIYLHPYYYFLLHHKSSFQYIYGMSDAIKSLQQQLWFKGHHYFMYRTIYKDSIFPSYFYSNPSVKFFTPVHVGYEIPFSISSLNPDLSFTLHASEARRVKERSGLSDQIEKVISYITWIKSLYPSIFKYPTPRSF